MLAASVFFSLVEEGHNQFVTEQEMTLNTPFTHQQDANLKRPKGPRMMYFIAVIHVKNVLPKKILN